jgi:hypothetical protein
MVVYSHLHLPYLDEYAVHDWSLVFLNVSFEVACIHVQEDGRMLGEIRGTSLIFEKRDTTLC